MQIVLIALPSEYFFDIRKNIVTLHVYSKSSILHTNIYNLINKKTR